VRNLHYTMAKPWQLRDPLNKVSPYPNPNPNPNPNSLTLTLTLTLNKGFGQLNQLWWDAFLRGAPGKGGKGVSVLNKVRVRVRVRVRG
jgi:hypothetical protein